MPDKEEKNTTKNNTKEKSTKKVFQYVGRKYKDGLLVHGVPGLIKPAQWDLKKAKAMIEKHPQLKVYFKF